MDRRRSIETVGLEDRLNAPAERALGRPAAARRRRPRPRQQADDHLRRRADRQPRLALRRRDPRVHARRGRASSARRSSWSPTTRTPPPTPTASCSSPTARSSTRWPSRRATSRRPHEADRPLSDESTSERISVTVFARRRPRARVTSTDSTRRGPPMIPAPDRGAHPRRLGGRSRSLAIVVGVSFVFGSFVLADSLKRRSTTCSPASPPTSTSRSRSVADGR